MLIFDQLYVINNHLMSFFAYHKNNYHQFQPLFYQVATSGLEPSSISFPLRKVFQNKKNVILVTNYIIFADYG